MTPRPPPARASGDARALPLRSRTVPEPSRSHGAQSTGPGAEGDGGCRASARQFRHRRFAAPPGPPAARRTRPVLCGFDGTPHTSDRGVGGSGHRTPPLPPRDAVEGKGPQRRPQRRSGRRLEEVAKAVGGGYCRLQMPLRLALGVRGTVAGHRLGALEGGGGASVSHSVGGSPPSNAPQRPSIPHTHTRGHPSTGTGGCTQAGAPLCPPPPSPCGGGGAGAFDQRVPVPSADDLCSRSGGDPKRPGLRDGGGGAGGVRTPGGGA